MAVFRAIPVFQKAAVLAFGIGYSGIGGAIPE
jgi:hypothetical protein